MAPQLTGGGAASLLPYVSVLIMIGGALVFVWALRPVRVAVRREMAHWHTRRFGPPVVAAAPEPGANAPERDARGLDPEKAAVDRSIYDEPDPS